jgi:hypothetical protein
MFHEPGHRAHIKELMILEPFFRPHIVELESMSSSCSTPEIIPLLPESYHTIPCPTIPYHTVRMYNDYHTLLLCSKVYHVILYYCITITTHYCCVDKYTISYCTTV